MRAELVRLGPRQLDHEVIWGAIGFVLGLIGVVYPFGRIHFACPFKALTGVPCPTCGMTRCLLQLREFDVLGALVMNPLVATLAMFAAVYCVYAWIAVLFRTRRIRMRVTRHWEPALIRILVVAVFLANWLFLIRAGR